MSDNGEGDNETPTDSKRWKSWQDEVADNSDKNASPRNLTDSKKDSGGDGDPAWMKEDAAPNDAPEDNCSAGQRHEVDRDAILKTTPILGCCCINFNFNCTTLCTGHQECLCCVCDCRCIKPTVCCHGTAQLCCTDSHCAFPTDYNQFAVPCLLNICGFTCCYRSTNIIQCCKSYLDLDEYLVSMLAAGGSAASASATAQAKAAASIQVTPTKQATGKVTEPVPKPDSVDL